MEDENLSHYLIDEDILCVSCEGSITIQDVCDYFVSIIDLVAAEKLAGVMMIDKGTPIIPDRSELNNLCKAIAASPKLCNKMAICIRNRLQTTMGNLVIGALVKPAVEVKLFPSIEEARIWLRKTTAG